MRLRLSILASFAAAALLVGIVWHFRSAKRTGKSADVTSSPDAAVIVGGSAESPIAPGSKSYSDSGPTNLYAHNLMLRKGPTGFRVYVRWIRGLMVRTARNINPSFDEPDSFVLDVKNGVIHTNVGDLANFLNEEVANSPFRGISLSGDGDTIKLHGTLHKIIPLPV